MPLNQSWQTSPDGVSHDSFSDMAMLKKKTRKAIQKSLNKAIKKHGPRVARHLATGLVAGLATYIGAEGKQGAKNLKKVAEALPSKKQLKKAAKVIPGGKQVVRAVSATVPLLRDAAEKVAGGNGQKKTKRGRSRGKKSATA